MRRSRERFKEDNNDKKDALATLRYVLQSVSLVTAPSMPFSAEDMYRNIRTDDSLESAHVCAWPKVNQKLINKDLEDKMSETRLIVNSALAERIAVGIKVKQPLLSLKVKNIKSKIRNEKDLLNLIKDEVNLKEIIFDKNISKEVELDVNLTEELREEGTVREIIRAVQDLRKQAGLKPADRILADFFGDEALVKIIEKNKELILKEVRAESFNIKNIGDDSYAEVLISGKKLSIFIKKV